jgi:hypothetical protein
MVKTIVETVETIAIVIVETIESQEVHTLIQQGGCGGRGEEGATCSCRCPVGAL